MFVFYTLTLVSHPLLIPTESDKKLAVAQIIIPCMYSATFPLVAFAICLLALVTICLILTHVYGTVFIPLGTSYLIFASICLPSSGKLVIHDSTASNKWCKGGKTSTFSDPQNLQQFTISSTLALRDVTGVLQAERRRQHVQAWYEAGGGQGDTTMKAGWGKTPCCWELTELS